MKLPERAAAFIQLQDRTIARYQQMIAWLAFMLGEDDEMALQRSLVATDEAIRALAPSVGEFDEQFREIGIAKPDV